MLLSHNILDLNLPDFFEIELCLRVVEGFKALASNEDSSYSQWLTLQLDS